MKTNGDESLDKLATDWVNKIIPEIYKSLDEIQVSYSEDVLWLLATDAFKAGYITRENELNKRGEK